MTDFLFRSIPKIIFEPFFACMLIYLALIFPFFRKRNKPLTLIVFFSVLFMVAWRVYFHSIVLSSRYAVILIFPAVAASACLCVKISALGIWGMKKCKWQCPAVRNFIRFFSVVAVVGLSIACVCKAVRFNTWESAYKKVCMAYLNHRKSGGEVFISHKEQSRIAWYCKLNKSQFKVLDAYADKPIIQVVRRKIEELKNIQGTHYFFFFVKKSEVFPTTSSMQLSSEYGKWEILSQHYNSSRKDRQIVLAGYTPVCPDMTVWRKKMPALPAGNICLAGEFEKCLDGKNLENSLRSFQQMQVAEYSVPGNRKLPWGWYPGIGKWNRNNPPDIRLTDKDALAGKYSLAVDAVPPRSSATVSNWRPFVRRSRYSLFVRAAGSSVSTVKVVAMTRDAALKKYKQNRIAVFALQPGETYCLHGDISTDNFPAGWHDYIFQIIVRGKVIIDNVSITYDSI